MGPFWSKSAPSGQSVRFFCSSTPYAKKETYVHVDQPKKILNTTRNISPLNNIFEDKNSNANY